MTFKASFEDFLKNDALQRRMLHAASFVVILASLQYLLARGVFTTFPEIDFKYIWHAGRLWSAGVDPYSDLFPKLAEGQFQYFSNVDRWLYPPNWWFISTALARLDIEAATLVWRMLGAACVVGGAALLALSVRNVLAHPRLVPIFAGLLLVTAFAQATPLAIVFGQTSLLVFFGAALVIWGSTTGAVLKADIDASLAATIRRRFAALNWAIVAGAMIVALKPQVGIFFFACLMVAGPFRAEIGCAGALSVMATIPPLFTFGVSHYLSFLQSMGTAGSLNGNSPLNTTGMRHLIFDATGWAAPISATTLFGVGAAVAASILFRRIANFNMPSDRMTLALIPVVFAVFFTPLHSYDLTLAMTAILALGLRTGRLFRLLVVASLAAMWRATNIAVSTGFHDRSATHVVMALGPHLETLALLALAAAFVWFVVLAPYLRRGPVRH